MCCFGIAIFYLCSMVYFVRHTSCVDILRNVSLFAAGIQVFSKLLISFKNFNPKSLEKYHVMNIYFLVTKINNVWGDVSNILG